VPVDSTIWFSRHSPRQPPGVTPFYTVPALNQSTGWVSSALPELSYYRDKHLYVDLREPRVILDGETVRLTPM
jgi:hypothetical protein